jgi:hypothetical protein
MTSELHGMAIDLNRSLSDVPAAMAVAADVRAAAQAHHQGGRHVDRCAKP